VLDIIGLCGSLLTVEEDTIYFVHQSAKDFLLNTKFKQQIFPDGTGAIHQSIFSRSLEALSETLRKDMYDLKELGTSIEDVQVPRKDPMAASRYPCLYWIDHLCDSEPELETKSCGDVQSADLVEKFIREKYLYWLEALSLCKSVAKGIISMARLCPIFEVCHALGIRPSLALDSS
jgi:hypothetical protein